MTVMPNDTLHIPEKLFHELEARAKASGTTVDHAATDLLTKALADEAAESQLLAQIKNERESMAGDGVFLTEESANEAKRWGRE